MDLFQELRRAIEDADDRDGAVANMVTRLPMTEDQARDVLDASFTKELREAMYPEGFPFLP